MKNTEFEYQYYGHLAERIRLGDSDAFTELYESTYADLYRYVHYFLKDQNVTQDILQEIYISVYRDISSLKLDRLLIPWMRQITYHICCDYSKKVKKNREISTDFTEGNMIADTASVAEDVYFQPVFDRDTMKELDRHLAKLPQKEKQAFLLRYESGLKLEEVADFMDLSLATVKRYIKHAREVLQKKLYNRSL